MTDPKYFVNIVYVPVQRSGNQLVSISGVTQSVPVYTSDFFVASMPELTLAATGSSYVESLNNLLAKATASNVYNNGHDPINNG